MNLQNRTGWRASPPSDKDFEHTLSSIGLYKPDVPTAASMEKQVIRIDDQKSKPWCVAFGTANAIEFQMRARGLSVPKDGFSKAWLYARCKQLDGIPFEDGTYIKTALWIALNEGLCPDYLCPTTEWLEKDSLPELNSIMAREAGKYKITGFSKLQDMGGYSSLYQAKQAIASGGFVIIASLVEMDNWLDGDDLLLVPKGKVLGGHCTYKFGYDDKEKQSIYLGFCHGANSWGEDWGSRGKYDMAYAYDSWRDSDGYPALLEAWAFSVAKPEPVKRCRICEWFRRWFR